MTIDADSEDDDDDHDDGNHTDNDDDEEDDGDDDDDGDRASRVPLKPCLFGPSLAFFFCQPPSGKHGRQRGLHPRHQHHHHHHHHQHHHHHHPSPGGGYSTVPDFKYTPPSFDFRPCIAEYTANAPVGSAEEGKEIFDGEGKAGRRDWEISEKRRGKERRGDRGRTRGREGGEGEDEKEEGGTRA
eukprot:62678-Pyramimonas_sp.AAC.1